MAGVNHPASEFVVVHSDEPAALAAHASPVGEYLVTFAWGTIGTDPRGLHRGHQPAKHVSQAGVATLRAALRTKLSAAGFSQRLWLNKIGMLTTET